VTDEQADAIIAELKAIREALSHPPRRRVALDAQHVELARAIAVSTAGTIFTAAEACEHARLEGQETLREAIAGACGSLSARRLGKALRRLEAADAGNVVVERVGSDAAGALWVSRVIETQQTPLRRFSIA
jgi:hypothetical protein